MLRQVNALLEEGAKSFIITHPILLREKLQIGWNWFHTVAQQKAHVKSQYLWKRFGRTGF
jgi:hypothetical protein